METFDGDYRGRASPPVGRSELYRPESFVSCRQSHLAGSVIEASAERMDTAPCSCKLRFWEFSSGEARWMVTGLDVDWWGDLLRSDGLHQGGQGQLLSQFSGGFVRSWIAGVWL